MTILVDVPHAWNRSRLRDLPIEFIDGDRSTRYPKRSELQSAGFPFLNSTCIVDNKLDLSNAGFVSAAKYAEMRKGCTQYLDIVMTTRGTIGKVAFFAKPNDAETLINAQMLIVRANGTDLDQRFLFYVLCSESFQHNLRNYASGSAQPQIPIRDLREVEICYPLLPTQRKIAAILSAYDDLIENNTRRIKILEEMAQLIYREWFVHFRFPGHENVRLVDSELGPIPEGWAVAQLGDVTRNYDSKRIPLSSLQRAERQGSYPYYGAAKVLDYVDDYIFDGVHLLVGEDGSVVTEDRKPMLQLVNGKFWVNNHAHVLQGASSISTYFLYLFLAGFDISGYITGAAQPKITQANLNRIPIVKPHTDIAECFNSIAHDTFQCVFQLRRKNEILVHMRNLLLPKLISGELDVENLDIDVGEP